MTIENFKAGLDILVGCGATGFCIHAQHDVFYCGPDLASVPQEKRDQLYGIGWAWDEGCESWRAFT